MPGVCGRVCSAAGHKRGHAPLPSAQPAALLALPRVNHSLLRLKGGEQRSHCKRGAWGARCGQTGHNSAWGCVHSLAPLTALNCFTTGGVRAPVDQSWVRPARNVAGAARTRRLEGVLAQAQGRGPTAPVHAAHPVACKMHWPARLYSAAGRRAPVLCRNWNAHNTHCSRSLVVCLCLHMAVPGGGHAPVARIASSSSSRRCTNGVPAVLSSMWGWKLSRQRGFQRQR